MEIRDGVYLEIFPESKIVIIFEGTKAEIEENRYGDIVVTYMFDQESKKKKLTEYFEDFNIPYHIPYGTTENEIQISYEPFHLNVHSFKCLIRKLLRSKRYLRWFLNEIFPPSVFLS